MNIDGRHTWQAPELEVLISTCGAAGMQRVDAMQLPEVPGVVYTVSWQQPTGDIAPSIASRKDVRVVKSGSTGLSNNRNDAFDISLAPLLLIADDDLDYTAGDLLKVIEVMEHNPHVDVAAFMQHDVDYKTYPPGELDLHNHFKNYFVTSFELAVRAHVVKGEERVSFDSEFGIGAARFHAAEESLFINDVLRHGYTVRFFPIEVVYHKGKTTGARTFTPGILRACGAYIRDTFVWYNGLVRLPLAAWRYYRAGRYTLLPAMWYMLDGWTHKRKPH